MLEFGGHVFLVLSWNQLNAVHTANKQHLF